MVSVEDNLGRQAIHQAAQAGAVDSIKFLVEECDIDPSTASSGQEVTPLHVAAKVRRLYYDFVIFCINPRI